MAHDRPNPDPNPASSATPVPNGGGAAGGRFGLAGRTGALVEWALWLTLAVVFWLQTGRFDEVIASYEFGASGWPRALAIAVAFGATGQLLHRLRLSPGPARAVTNRKTATPWVRVQRVLIFVLPLIWLWIIPWVGFYLATPYFIAALLLVLDVRSPLAVLGVTAVVYGLVLVLFTRYFYVGLPTGSMDPFYDWNNWIIATARWGT